MENFSGIACKEVQQDFYVNIFIINLRPAAISPANKYLKKQGAKVRGASDKLYRSHRPIKKYIFPSLCKKNYSRNKGVARRLTSVTGYIKKARKFKGNLQKRKQHIWSNLFQLNVTTLIYNY